METKHIVIIVVVVGIVLAVPLLAGLAKKGQSSAGGPNDPNAMVNIEGIGSTSALGAAIGTGDREKVQAFLDRGANLRDPIKLILPPAPGSELLEGTCSALLFGVLAVEGGKAPVEFLQYLIDNGADVNHRDSWDCVPLFSAVFSVKLSQTGDVARLLLKNGADPNASSRRPGNTALYWAAARGYKEVAEALIEYGADVNVRFRDRTPLSYAKEKGHMDVVQVLLQHGGTE